MRGAALPAASVAVTPAPVATLVASTLVAIAGLASVALLARFHRRRAVRHNGRGAFAGRCRLRPAEILVTAAPALPMPFALGILAGFARRGFTCAGRLRAFGGTIGATGPMTIVTLRPPFIRTPTRAPDFDQLGLGWRRGCGCFS